MWENWSGRVLRALRANLPTEDRPLIANAHVVKGWGDIHYVTIFATVSRRDAGQAFEIAVHMIVRGVLDGCRQSTRIVWATAT